MTDKTSPPNPNTAGQQGQGRVSLWKRASRTLGEGHLAFLQSREKPSHEETSASEDPKPAAGGAAPSRRREQVRLAQRTHRQRTQNYIQTLEEEVVRLRKSESSLTREKDRLYRYIDSLKAVISVNNIPLPAGLEEKPQAHSPPWGTDDPEDLATVSYRKDDLGHLRLHVSMPTAPAKEAFNHTGFQAQPTASYINPQLEDLILADDVIMPDMPNAFSPVSSGPSNTLGNPSPTIQRGQTNHVAPISLASDEVGLDFILALEYPCMPHIVHPNDQLATTASNHAYTASMTLVHEAPRPPRPNATWNLPRANIQTLLDLAANIELDDEITPVEAWNQLRNHPRFPWLDQQALERLKRELSSQVKCYGFGAVLERNVFDQTIQRVLK